MQAHQSLTLVQAVGLACLQEEKLLDIRHPPRPRAALVTLGSAPPFAPPPLLSSLSHAMPTPLKCLSSDKIASHREKGLYFNYDEKFHRGHRCASGVFLLIAEGEDKDLDPNTVLNDPPDPPDKVDLPNPSPTQISFHSLAGHLALKTLRLSGSFSGRQVVVLVDGGGTYNFIQQEMVTQLNMSCRDTPFPLWVMVGNIQHLLCTSLCEATLIDIQSMQFAVDLHVLPISGAYVVLGVQWLKSLGPLLTDYNILCMQFFYQGRMVELNGDQDDTPNFITLSQFWRISQTQALGLYYHITLLSKDSPNPQDLHPDIQSLLTKFAHLFHQPSTLSSK